jgi:hypothetical protein
MAGLWLALIAIELLETSLLADNIFLKSYKHLSCGGVCGNAKTKC